MRIPGLRSIGRAVLRAAAAAAGPESVASTLFGMWRSTPRLGAEQMLAAYSQMPWLRSFTSKIAADVAAIQWQVYVVTDKRGNVVADRALQRCSNAVQRQKLLAPYAKDARMREVTDHPMLDFISGGNQWFGANTSMELTQIHLELVGEMAWLIADDGLKPTGYVPIPPTWVTALPQDNNGNYRVMGPSGAWDVPPSSLLFGYHPDPANPFRRGIGIAQVLGDELETDEYAAKYTKDWFVNRAIPPVLISGVGVHVDELKRLEEKWLTKFKRQGAGWLPHFLSRDVNVHQLSQTFEQQQLGPLRDRERDMIRQVWGIPPEQIGDVDSSNRATIEVSDYIYNTRLIVPRAEFLRSLMQARLMERFNDDRLVLGYVSPVREDTEFQLKVRQASPWASTVDEWRQFGGLDPLPAKRGQVLMVPFSTTPVRVTDLGAPPPEPPPVDDGSDNGQPPPKQIRGRRLIVAKTIPPGNEREIADAAKPAALSTRGQKVLREMVKQFGQDAMDSIADGTAFEVTDPRVIEHLRDFSGDRITGKVNRTTRDSIRRTISEGVEAGENIESLSSRIRAVFSEADGARSRLIARTEVTRSSNFGALEGMKQAGIEQKEWLATMDDLTRDEHAQLDGQVQDMGDAFQASNGQTAQYPGEFGDPAMDCNCRCGVLPVIPRDEASGVTLIVTRDARYKENESRRAPWVRLLETALREGFREQERAVLAALERVAAKNTPAREAMIA